MSDDAKEATMTPPSAATPRDLQWLLDRQAILDCVTRYARALDRHDSELLTSVFHEDAIDHHGPFIGTRDEFVPWAKMVHEADSAAHLHAVTNNSVEIDGDVAHSESYVLFTHLRRDGSGIDMGGGRYIDRLERRDGEWKIAARELIVEWFRQAAGAVYTADPAYLPGKWDHSDPSYRRPFVLELQGKE